ncbi:Selenoprotein W [Hondaea fermentalgiana]|uniref:Selenoprotein W n=1 Tax=Hondaea fermentalgiana TaxID=2315210 RepID=A0A2R5GEH8_9STRA|nr:Selenoprotein W [Hondaea fermentalgiana]|eukprot:GBG26631.1 Selenoprotein W [Hondaea fermentalgiana]
MEHVAFARDKVIDTVADLLLTYNVSILGDQLNKQSAGDWAKVILQVGFLFLVSLALLVQQIRRFGKGPFEERVVHEVDANEEAVDVTIQWCGGCGFQDAYEATEKLLTEKYPRKVRIISRRDADVTGNFEVTVNDYLAHSMRTKRQGFVHNQPARQKAIFAAIDVALEELHEKES